MRTIVGCSFFFNIALKNGVPRYWPQNGDSGVLWGGLTKNPAKRVMFFCWERTEAAIAEKFNF